MVAGIVSVACGFSWAANMGSASAAGGCVNGGDVSGCQTVTLEKGLSNEALVDRVLAGDIGATDVRKVGYVEAFSDGRDATGINRGIVLITSDEVINVEVDPDLDKMIGTAGNSYGGDTALIEFSMVAEGNLLNFDYSFASREFDQPVQFNDVFALFVSVNGGEYENIALITRSNGAQVPVNIVNLKAGLSGSELVGQSLPSGVHEYSLFTSKPIMVHKNSEITNGVSKVLNAQKEVNVGDQVKVKIVVADVGDSAWDSYVFIKANSLEFEEHGVKVSYLREVLYSLEDETEYEITDGENDYTITTDENGEIPLVGVDDNGEDYDFFGAGLTIDDGETVQTIEILPRPEAPDGPEPTDGNSELIQNSDNEITFPANPDKEYSVDEINWVQPNEDGSVTFDDLEPGTEYTVYARTPATPTTPASRSTRIFTVTTTDSTTEPEPEPEPDPDPEPEPTVDDEEEILYVPDTGLNDDNDFGLLVPDTGRAMRDMFGARSGGIGYAVIFAIGLATSIKLWIKRPE